MAASRFRLQFKFWLNVKKSDEYELAGLIEELKQAGSFTKAVRDGLRLVVDLWQGRVEVLLALFPWVEEYFFQQFSERQSVPDQAIVEQLAKLEQLLVEQGNKPISSITANGNGLKSMAVSPVSAPVADDNLDDVRLEIKQAKSDGLSSQNFLASAFSLVN